MLTSIVTFNVSSIFALVAFNIVFVDNSIHSVPSCFSYALSNFCILFRFATLFFTLILFLYATLLLLATPLLYALFF